MNLSRALLIACGAIGPCILSWIAAAEPVESRHIYVIYDVSLSYQFNHRISWDDDRAAIMDSIERIGASIDDEDYFSFLPMDGNVRYDCAPPKRRDRAHGAEVFGATIESRDDDEDGKLGTGWADWETAWEDHLHGFRDAAARAKYSEWTQKTDLKGALYRASYAFRKYPARRNYLLIFSDLDDDPAADAAPLCGTLDLSNVEVHVIDFGRVLSEYVLNKTSRPSAERRIANFQSLLRRAKAQPCTVDDDEGILEDLGLGD